MFRWLANNAEEGLVFVGKIKARFRITVVCYVQTKSAERIGTCRIIIAKIQFAIVGRTVSTCYTANMISGCLFLQIVETHIAQDNTQTRVYVGADLGIDYYKSIAREAKHLSRRSRIQLSDSKVSF
jgi:hypothetical protein